MSASRAQYAGFAAVRNSVYNLFMRRSSVFAIVIVALGYAGSEAMNNSVERAWERYNKGKLWKHLEAEVRAKQAQEAAAAGAAATASDSESAQTAD